MKKLALTLAATGALFAGVASQAHAANTHVCGQQPPITASWRTSCAFAGTAFSQHYKYAAGARSGRMMVYSPTTKHTYILRYVRRGGHRNWGGMVTMTGPNGIWLKFRSY